MVEVSCPHCGAKLKAPDERIGRKAKCKKCQQSFRVPGPAPSAESAGEGQMLSVALPLPLPDEDAPAELMGPPPTPAPQARPAAPPPVALPLPPVKDLSELPSADPFDFTAPAPKPTPPAAKSAPVPVPAAKPAAPPPVPATAVPATRPAFGSAKVAPPAPAAIPLEDIPFDDEPPKEKPKAKAKSKPAVAPLPAPEPIPGGDGASAFGFTDEPTPEPAKPPKARKRPEEEPDERPRKKKPRDADEATDEDAESKPRYLRPEEKGKGMMKAIVLTAVAALVALGLGAAAVIVVVKGNKKAEPTKKEEKKEEPAPEQPPPGPPVTPKGPDPKPKEKEPDPKPKDKEPEPKPKEPESGPTRPPLDPVTLKAKSFDLGKEPAKYQRTDDKIVEEQRCILESPVTAVARIFPSFDGKADSYVAVRDGAKYALDAYSPAGNKRISRLPFAATGPRPACDVFQTATEARLLAVADNKITVWNVLEPDKAPETHDPYAGKPEHAKNGIAAAYFSEQPSQIVVVSTAGAVHLYNANAKGTVAEFLPPNGYKGAVALDAAVAKAEGGGSVVLAVGGVLYQIRAGGNLEQLRKHDLGGDVKPLAVAGWSHPGRLAVAFETAAKGKKDRFLAYFSTKPTDKAVFTLWPAAAGSPANAFWVNDTVLGVATDGGVAWFDEEMDKFAPIAFTRPTLGAGVYRGSKNWFWYVVARPSAPAAQSVLVPLPIPFGDQFDLRRESATKMRLLRIDPNGVEK